LAVLDEQIIRGKDGINLGRGQSLRRHGLSQIHEVASGNLGGVAGRASGLTRQSVADKPTNRPARGESAGKEAEV
jgi:hypothetical protein